MNDLEKELAAEHALLFSLQRNQRRDFIDGTQTDKGESVRTAKMKGHAGNLGGIILRHISQNPVTVNTERGFASTLLGELSASDVRTHVENYFGSGLSKVQRQGSRVIVRIDSNCIQTSSWLGDNKCEWADMQREDHYEQQFEHYVGLCNRGLMSPEELRQKEEEKITTGSRWMPADKVMRIAQSVKDRFARHGK